MSDPEESLAPSARRVQAELVRRGSPARVRELPASTRSAAEAALAIGCQVAEIAKSLVFRFGGAPILVVVGGDRRVDEAKLGALLGGAVERADADFVRDRTGFAIGGVPPLGHSEPVRVFVDQALLNLAVVWAAAGTPHAVFRSTPAELVRLAAATVADLSR